MLRICIFVSDKKTWLIFGFIRKKKTGTWLILREEPLFLPKLWEFSNSLYFGIDSVGNWKKFYIFFSCRIWCYVDTSWARSHCGNLFQVYLQYGDSINRSCFANYVRFLINRSKKCNTKRGKNVINFSWIIHIVPIAGKSPSTYVMFFPYVNYILSPLRMTSK